MTRFQSLPPGFRGSILKSKTTNNAVTVPVPQKNGFMVIFRNVPKIINKNPNNSKIWIFLFNCFSPVIPVLNKSFFKQF